MKKRCALAVMFCLGMTLSLTTWAQGLAPPASAVRAAPPFPKSAKSAAIAAPDVTAEDVQNEVQQYLEEVAGKEGFRVYDVVERKELFLAFKELLEQELRALGRNAYVTSASFSSADGTEYEIDFQVTGPTASTLTVDPENVSIRVAGGTPRYAWEKSEATPFFRRGTANTATDEVAAEPKEETSEE